MAEVFISYSSNDAKKANTILTKLEESGISCWLSHRDIPPGADYAVEIPKAITECTYFILLLTNAAQDSPYVMLELDQAFKQKKNIIPVLLEEVAQNGKTNFFLNAKQQVNATADLTAAMNDVIQQIRPVKPKGRTLTGQQSKQTTVNQRDYILCPYCRCTYFKSQTLRIDKYLDQYLIWNNTDRIINLFMKNRRLFEFVHRCSTFFIALIMVLLLGMAYFDETVQKAMENAPEIIEGLYLLSILALIAVIASICCKVISNMIDVERDLIRAIKCSKLEYHSFKCANCEKTFGALIPKNAKIEDHVEKLLDRRKRN